MLPESVPASWDTAVWVFPVLLARFTHAATVNEPVVSSTGPPVAICCPDAPGNDALLPVQFPPEAVAGCPPLAESGTLVPDVWVSGYQATGPPAPGCVTDCEVTLP